MPKIIVILLLKRLLKGEIPRLIDEWQIAPKLWDAVRFEVDHRDEFGQFILTGSSVPASYEHIHHTGTGRFSWLLMRPMSLYESWDSTGEVSVKKLFEAPEQIEGENTLDLDRLAFLVCRGGWPRATDLEGDIAANEAETFDSDTVYSYINALKKIFVIEEMEAWNPNLRSKTAIRTSNTRYFVDSSIAAAALGLGPQDLMEDLNTFGLLFETMCIRDLRVFADGLNGNVYHFRDKTGLECDAVLHLRDGAYGLIEIKLGGEKLIEEGAENLKKLRNKIDTTKMKDPAFLMVLTGVGDYAYRRQDGVYIVPIGCLKD